MQSFFFFTGARPTLMAEWNTSLSPACVKAEHSTYFAACKVVKKLNHERVIISKMHTAAPQLSQ